MRYLCIPEEFETNGEKKTSWNRIGTIFEGKNGKTYAKLFTLPGVLIHVFDKEKKEAKENSDEITF